MSPSRPQLRHQALEGRVPAHCRRVVAVALGGIVASGSLAPLSTALLQVTFPASAHPRPEHYASCRHDGFLEWMCRELQRGGVQHHRQTLARIEAILHEPARGVTPGVLRRRVPEVYSFHLPPRLCDAYEDLDEKLGLSGRNMTEDHLRPLLNRAQVLAVAANHNLRLVTLDGDGTLYPHDKCFGTCEVSRSIASSIGALLLSGVIVAVVTAAAYGRDAARYEERIGNLLQALADDPTLGDEDLQRFYLLGGSCHFLMRAQLRAGDGGGRSAGLELVEERRDMWKAANIAKVLDIGERVLREGNEELGLQAELVRKECSVGLVRSKGRKLSLDELDELTLRAQQALSARAALPWCASHSNVDVWVDAGNKQVGIERLQDFLGGAGRLRAAECVHIGDQFLPTGNDVAARACATCLWVSGPADTAAQLQELATGAAASGSSKL